MEQHRFKNKEQKDKSRLLKEHFLTFFSALLDPLLHHSVIFITICPYFNYSSIRFFTPLYSIFSLFVNWLSFACADREIQVRKMRCLSAIIKSSHSLIFFLFLLSHYSSRSSNSIYRFVLWSVHVRRDKIEMSTIKVMLLEFSVFFSPDQLFYFAYMK